MQVFTPCLKFATWARAYLQILDWPEKNLARTKRSSLFCFPINDVKQVLQH